MSSEKGSKGILLYNTNITRYSMTNILDQPIEKINVPVLKPVKITKSQPQSLIQLAGNMVNHIQNKINDFTKWILSYIPQVDKKPVNQKVEI